MFFWVQFSHSGWVSGHCNPLVMIAYFNESSYLDPSFFAVVAALLRLLSAQGWPSCGDISVHDRRSCRRYIHVFARPSHGSNTVGDVEEQGYSSCIPWIVKLINNFPEPLFALAITINQAFIGLADHVLGDITIRFRSSYLAQEI
jgi:hypothetical protein